MTHVCETIQMLAEHIAVMVCSLGIAIRVVSASCVFGMVHGPDQDRETAILVSVTRPSIVTECWATLDELQAGLLGVAAMVFYYELHAFTAAGNAIVVSYLLLNVGVVGAPGLLQAGQDVLNRIEDNKPLLTTQQ